MRSRERHARTRDDGNLDEMVVTIQGRRMYLWRAVDSEGEVLDLLVQSKRDTKAALRLMRKLLKKQGYAPEELVTDKLGSYGAALRELGLSCHHDSNGSSQSAQPSGFCRCMLRSTTRSTFSATSSPAALSASSEPTYSGTRPVLPLAWANVQLVVPCVQ
jgi:transposase-like protein